MENRLQLALEESSKNLQLPIKAEHAKYGNVEGKNPKNKCIVCLTSAGIHIREEAKSVKLKANYIWYDLIKISINGSLLQLTFRQREKDVKKENNDSDSETLIIEIIENKAKLNNSKNQKDNVSSNFEIFIQYLSDILQRVLTPFELKRIFFYSSILAEKVKPTFISIMSRLSMILPLQKYSISQASIETLKSMLFSHQPVFNLSTFKDTDVVIPILFELFPLINYLEVVKIPEVNNFPVYKASSYFLFQLNCVKFIEINGPKDDGFDSFLQKLPNSNIQTTSYSYSNFNAQDLELISKTILDSDIHCLEFHEAINGNDKTSFYDNFLNTDICTHIWSLNLNNTSNLNLPILLKKLTYISSLSLAYCNIEINSTIKLICESKMDCLKYLNLSGNLCNETLDVNINLPISLTHIMVNDVSWNDKSLTSFMSFVLQLSKNEKNQKIHRNHVNKSQKPRELYLSISHAITLQLEWSRLFQLLHFNYSTSSMNVSFLQFRNSSHSSYNFSELRNAIPNEDDDDEQFHPVSLRSLAWDENPVDPSFFDFLRESKELETLSLNSCFHETLDSSLALFVDYIKANDSLQRLFVAGSKKVHLGKKVIKVIEACLDKKNLKILDLSISKCDSNCLLEFIPLFDAKRSSLEVVILDGIFPSNADIFLNFLNQIKCMNSKTKISFPSGDCLLLKKQRKMSQKHMSQINSIYKSIAPNGEKDDIDERIRSSFREENDEEDDKSSSSAQSKNSSSNNSKKNNVIKAQKLKHSEFLKQPYYYRYFYEPFIPYYLELDEINQIRANKFKVEEEMHQNENINENNNVIENNHNQNQNEVENDDFTLLQIGSGVKDAEEEEEEGEDIEKEENKTFTIHLADFENNLIEEEEEEEEGNDLDDLNEEEEAFPVDFNNSVNIIKTMQKALIDKNESGSSKNNFLNSTSQRSVKQKLIVEDKVLSDVNEEEEENESDDDERVNVEFKPKSPQKNIVNSNSSKKQIKRKKLIDENEEENEEEKIEPDIKVKRKPKVKSRQINKSKKPIKQIKKKLPNKSSNVVEEEENEIENKPKRTTILKKKQQISKAKKQTKQVKKRVINKNYINNNNEEEENEAEMMNRKIVRQKSQQQQQLQKPIKKQMRKRIIKKENMNNNFNNNNDNEETDSKNRRIVRSKRTQQTIKNKKPTRQQSKRKSPSKLNEEEEITESDDDNSPLYQKSDVLGSFDDSFEKTEVDDTIMNVTVGANDFNEYDDFETYESYELGNQFTTPRQAKGSNLNRNVSKNKNKNKPVPVKNKQNITRKNIKKDDAINDDDDDDKDDYKLSPKIKSLINNFSLQYNLNDFEIIFQNFDPIINNSEIWTNMNEEFSINKLFNNMKVVKDSSY